MCNSQHLFNFHVKNVALSVCGCILLAGCAMQKTEPHDASDTQDMVTTAAKQIHEELIELRSMLDGKKKVPDTNRPYAGPLAKPVMFSWVGPAIPAIRTVAELIDFQLEVQGHLSKVSPIIRIDAKKRPALSVLEDIGWQCGPSMGVVVRESEKTIYVFFEK